MKNFLIIIVGFISLSAQARDGEWGTARNGKKYCAYPTAGGSIGYTLCSQDGGTAQCLGSAGDCCTAPGMAPNSGHIQVKGAKAIAVQKK